MPNKETPGVVDDEPVIQEEESKEPKAPETLEVDLDEQKPEAAKPEDAIAQKVRDDLDRLYSGKLDQVENRLRGAQRINTQLQQKLQALEQRLAPKAPVTPESQRDAELQALVDKGDWQTAVGKIAEERAAALYQQRLQLEQQQSQIQAMEQTLDQSRQLVSQRYPDLDVENGDPDSDISRTFNAILNQDPGLLRNPYGPEIAMHRMEEAIRAQQSTEQNAETARQQRVGQGGLPVSRGAGVGGKVTLDKEQKEFIDYHGIDPKVYAQMQQSLAQHGGVEAS